MSCSYAAVNGGMYSGFAPGRSLGRGVVWSLGISLVIHAGFLMGTWSTSVVPPDVSPKALNVELVAAGRNGNPAQSVAAVSRMAQGGYSGVSSRPGRAATSVRPAQPSALLPSQDEKRLPVLSSAEVRSDNRTGVLAAALPAGSEGTSQDRADAATASAGGSASRSDGIGAGAGSRSDASRTSKPTVDDAAGSGLRKDDLRQYRTDLIAIARAVKSYPALARERGWEGTVEVELKFSAATRLKDVTTIRSGGHRQLDEQALETVRQAAAAVPLPDSLAGADFRLLLPVVFSFE